MKFFIEDFFSKCDQIRSFLRIWSHLLKKSLMENFIFGPVKVLIKSTHKLQSQTKYLEQSKKVKVKLGRIRKY